MKAMILAAGLATRLRPYSLIRPKPLFPVLNTPLLLWTIARLRQQGFGPIVVNAHHLADQIEQALQHIPGIILQHEEKILGTGGGLRRALVHFTDEPVLVVNSDIFHTLDLADLYRQHLDDGGDISLVMHDFPRYNSVSVDAGFHVTAFQPGGSATSSSNGKPDRQPRQYAFTGIHIINPDILRSIPKDAYATIIDCYKDHLARGGSIRAIIREDFFWSDMGTPADYLKLHADLLTHKVLGPAVSCLDPGDSPLRLHHDARIGKGVRMEEWVCIGAGARIGDHAQLRRAVVWDGAVVEENGRVTDAIIT
jgi:mannose-1-phosphate guanylyltransferase